MTYEQIIGLIFAIPFSILIAWALSTILIGVLAETTFQIKELRKNTALAWNNGLSVKIKRLHPNAVLPKYAKSGDAGLDLTATSQYFDSSGNMVYGTGWAFEIPEGHCMLLLPRSSNHKTSLVLTNHVGLVDSGYRGEIFFKFAEYQRRSVMGHVPDREEYKIGDRIGQAVIIPYPTIEFEEVNELSKSERGTGGYGSTGK